MMPTTPRVGTMLSWLVAVLMAAPAAALPNAASLRGEASDRSYGSRPRAQQTQAPATETADSLVRDGFTLCDRHEHAAAKALFDRALSLALQDRDVALEAAARSGLGLVGLRTAQYPDARAQLEQAMAVFRALGDHQRLAQVLETLGSIAYQVGNRVEARQRYEEALAEFDAIGNLRGKANTLRNLTFVTGLGTETDGLLEQGLVIARQIGDKALQGTLLHNRGDLEFTRGDRAAAFETLKQAAQLLEEASAETNLARVLVSMGRVQRAHGHPELAIPLYRRALGIQQRTGDKPGVIQSYNAIGVAYSSMGRRQDALREHRRALVLAEQTGSPESISFMRSNVGSAYVSLGAYTRGAALLRQSLEHDRGPYGASSTYLGLARAYLGLAQHERALPAANRGLELMRQAGDLERIPNALYTRARIEQKMQRIPEALADIREALGTVEALRTQLVPSDFMKRGFSEIHRDIFSVAINLLHRAGQDREALETTERARARAFLDLLASREVSDLSRRPDPEAVRQPTDPPLDSLVSASPASVDDLVATAQRLSSTLLCYWVTDEETLIWVLSPDGRVRAASVRVSAKRLGDLIRQAAGTMEGGTLVPPGPVRGALPAIGRPPLRIWRELYTLLIRPVRRHLPQAEGSLLTIVPHGPLFRLSFAALLNDRDRYLLETYRLHYAPSGGVLQFTGRKTLPVLDRAGGYLLVANPAVLPRIEGGPRLPALPGTTREVQAIVRAVGADRATILTGAGADEASVRRLVAGKSVVHFATHAVLRDNEPLSSFLALDRTTIEGTNDGRLTVEEVYGLDLHADLVVLSACRTATGQVTGDGVAGLTRAFFYAGTRSVIATLSEMADQPGARLMPAFYRAWLRTSDKSRALRAAQLSLLRDLRAGRVTIDTQAGNVTLAEHPFFWASFVLLGEP